MNRDSFSFAEWVHYIFDYRVSAQAYYRDEEVLELPPAQFISFGARLFRESPQFLGRFSDAQVDAGLWLILGSDVSLPLKDETISLEDRIAFLDSLFDLIQDTFEVRCTPHLSHLDRWGTRTPSHVSPLNSICYMLWDIFMYGDRDDPIFEPLKRASFRVMTRSLALKNISVLEGALHGLGHYSLCYPDDAEIAIDQFLNVNPGIPLELVAYAKNARDGKAL